MDRLDTPPQRAVICPRTISAFILAWGLHKRPVWRFSGPPVCARRWMMFARISFSKCMSRSAPDAPDSGSVSRVAERFIRSHSAYGSGRCSTPKGHLEVAITEFREAAEADANLTQ